MILSIFSGFAISLAFAIFFNAPKRALLPIILMGILAVLVKKQMLAYGFSLEVSTFAASFGIGLLCIYFSARQRIPILVYAISSSIVLVPTINAYKAIIGLIQISTHQIMSQELIVQSLHYSLKTWLVFGAIAIGIVLPTQFIGKYRFKLL